jgi:hypothetical protein
MIRKGQTLKQMVRLPKDPESCWEWQGFIHPESGVAMKAINGRCVPARRWMWENLFGPIPKGMVIAQACGNTACVNPYHLKQATLATALRDGLTAKLVASDAVAIRKAKDDYVVHRAGKRLRLAELARSLADIHEVTPNTIRDIWRGHTWRAQTKHPFARSHSEEAHA